MKNKHGDSQTWFDYQPTAARRAYGIGTIASIVAPSSQIVVSIDPPNGSPNRPQIFRATGDKLPHFTNQFVYLPIYLLHESSIST